MPLAVDSLTPDSSSENVQRAISESIVQCIREGGKREECTAQAHSIAERKTGAGASGVAARSIKVGLEELDGTSSRVTRGTPKRITG